MKETRCRKCFSGLTWHTDLEAAEELRNESICVIENGRIRKIRDNDEHLTKVYVDNWKKEDEDGLTIKKGKMVRYRVIDDGHGYSEWLTTGEMIDRLKIGQKAEVVANGYIGGKVYIWESPFTGYKELRWEGDKRKIFSIEGFIFDTKWRIVEADKK